MITALSNRMKELMRAKDWDIEDVAEKSGLPYETVRNVYYGKTADPKISTIMKLAKAFNLSVNCLMGDCQHTPEERALLQYFRSCGHHGRSLILMSAKYEALSAKEERESTGTHKITCLLPEGDIYHGIEYDNCKTEEIWVSNDNADVAIKMTNNCLMPIYCKGDTILIADRFPHDHEYGVFYYKSKAYIRQYVERENEYVLKCLHKYDKDLVFKRMDEIEYLGTCIGVVRA